MIEEKMTEQWLPSASDQDHENRQGEAESVLSDLLCVVSIELAQAKNLLSRACTGMEFDESWISGRTISEERRKELFKEGCAILDKWIEQLPDLPKGDWRRENKKRLFSVGWICLLGGL